MAPVVKLCDLKEKNYWIFRTYSEEYKSTSVMFNHNVSYYINLTVRLVEKIEKNRYKVEDDSGSKVLVISKYNHALTKQMREFNIGDNLEFFGIFVWVDAETLECGYLRCFVKLSKCKYGISEFDEKMRLVSQANRKKTLINVNLTLTGTTDKSKIQRQLESPKGNQAKCFYGPFPLPLGSQIFGKDFSYYTTYQHVNGEKCFDWKVNRCDWEKKVETMLEGKDEGSIRADISESNGNTYSGTFSSLHDKAIYYTCEKNSCTVKCVCTLCNSDPCERKCCSSRECNVCSTQCTEHKCRLSRDFNRYKHMYSFSTNEVPAYESLGPKYPNPGTAGTDHPRFLVAKLSKEELQSEYFEEFPGLPFDCKVCISDLQDHDLNHHVIHLRCKLCQVTEKKLSGVVSLQTYVVRKMLTFRKEEHTCRFCGIFFKKISNRYKHEVNKTCFKLEERERKVKCDICNKKFFEVGNLVRHVKTVHVLLTFKCNECYEVFNRKTNFESHFEEYHSKGKEFECDECRDVFDTYDDVLCHLDNEHDYSNRNDVKCEVCSECFTRQDNLDRHIKNFHGEKVLLFRCDQCRYESVRQSNVDRHKRDVHFKDEQKQLVCNICDYKTIRNYDLTRHLEHVHLKFEQKQLVCNICGAYKTTRKQDLTRHIEHVHFEGQRKKLVCDMCHKYKTTREGDLTRHIKYVHWKSEQKQFLCDMCDYETTRQHDLTKHIEEMHLKSELKQFMCDMCEYETRRKRNLTIHIKHVHLKPAQRQFVCDMCDYETTRQDNLTRHIKDVHLKSNEKHFLCDICGYETTRHYDFTRHMGSHRRTVHSPQNIKCEQCNFTTDVKKKLTQHIKRKH